MKTMIVMIAYNQQTFVPAVGYEKKKLLSCVNDMPKNPPASEATLRDVFAGQAMTASISNETHTKALRSAEESRVGYYKLLATESYDIADAMLSQREKGGEV